MKALPSALSFILSVFLLAVTLNVALAFNACDPSTPVLPCTNAYSIDMDSVMRDSSTTLFYRAVAYDETYTPDSPYNYRGLSLKSGYSQTNGYSYLGGPNWYSFGQFNGGNVQENTSFVWEKNKSFLPIPQSAVDGELTIIGTSGSCSGVTIWCFNQHQSGLHTSTGGIGSSDDVLAWDINLNNPQNTDLGDPVYAVEDGTVATTYAGQTNAGGTYGQILIQHDYNGLTWWSGYLHLTGITKSTGNSVTKGELIGYISCTGLGGNPCTTDDAHLHLIVYTGTNSSGSLTSFNTIFTQK